MKKVLLTILFVYIAVRVMCAVFGPFSFLISLIVDFIVSFLIMIIWNIYPICKITNHHVPVRRNGVYYCKYCNKPLFRIK